MKRMTQMVVMAAGLVVFAGLAQAGRGIDSSVTLHKGATAGNAADAGGAAYTGRPNESVAIAPVRSEGEAEFAVMDVQGGTAPRGAGAYNGRPMDNPAR